jgi:hypothetical protein
VTEEEHVTDTDSDAPDWERTGPEDFKGEARERLREGARELLEELRERGIPSGEDAPDDPNAAA